jgi:hypothetical protein
VRCRRRLTAFIVTAAAGGRAGLPVQRVVQRVLQCVAQRALRALVPPLVLLAVVGAGGAGCGHVAPHAAPGPAPRLVEADDIARAIPARVPDRAGWADDIATAIRATKKEPTAERACAVVAVIAQESGFVADPVVAHLPALVRRALDEKLAPLGPLAGVAVDAVLAGRVPGTRATFGERIDRLKTERDLDRLFRDVSEHVRRNAPAPLAGLALLAGDDLIEGLNPVTTAGSMQVKVSFARRLFAVTPTDDVREQLYTRSGGVRAGVARLIGYRASYDDVVYRFADYNAGVYASRNAALQTMLADLTGERLVADGDLLAWDDEDTPRAVETHTLRALLGFAAAHRLSERTVRNDVRLEKTAEFETTSTWKAVRDAWQRKTGRPPPYARIPDVALSSPKLKQPRTTAWYAKNVKLRYDACRQVVP